MGAAGNGNTDGTNKSKLSSSGDNNSNNHNREHTRDPSSANHNHPLFGSKPIADLFPRATILFADIAGFTAWSSTREPTQVFTLLETVYNSFDIIAGRMGVFKVETIGDCYMAATGLPEPHPDHALVMARFAREAILKMDQVVKKLEIVL
jgi:class 3 adenylate cyclase